jgi:hypothetical protein
MNNFQKILAANVDLMFKHSGQRNQAIVFTIYVAPHSCNHISSSKGWKISKNITALFIIKYNGLKYWV